MKLFTRFLLSICILSTLPHATQAQRITADNPLQMNNLVIFVRFADDAEINKNIADIDPMFNSSEEGYRSVWNYYIAASYGSIHLRTLYADQIGGEGNIVSYTDTYPRGYFMPYSASNPDGYTDEVPLMGIHPRERELLARVTDYVEQNHLVADSCNLDGDGDGKIDNVSFIIKGGVGAWASILWPHMEFFPQDSMDHTVQINGYSLHAFNMEFEGSSYFSIETFCHELGHSLRIPDFYHYTDFTNVDPVGPWDIMANGRLVHSSAIVKYKYLHTVDDPIEITEDGTYTLNSVGSSPSQNLYYIRSRIDSTQWYTIEYRNRDDAFESQLPISGLLIGRWADTTTVSNMYMGNAFFHYPDHAHSYWIFRPGSSHDTIQGYVSFASLDGRENYDRFDGTTDPHSYLTDGTPENLFALFDIEPNGTTCSFKIQFNNADIDEVASAGWRCYPNPASNGIHIALPNEGTQSLTLHDALGRCVMRKTLSGGDTYLPLQLPKGVYTLTIGGKREKLMVN